jgi:hypothetical protein
MASDALTTSPCDEAYELTLARVRFALWALFVAFILVTLADVRLPHGGSAAIHLVRIVQFLLVGVAARAIHSRPRRGVLVAATVATVTGVYITSAIAGYLRADAITQPLTDLVIAYTSATTIPWGAVPQLVTIAVAMAAIAGNVYGVEGSFASMTPHVVVAIVIAFAARSNARRMPSAAASGASARSWSARPT